MPKNAVRGQRYRRWPAGTIPVILGSGLSPLPEQPSVVFVDPTMAWIVAIVAVPVAVVAIVAITTYARIRLATRAGEVTVHTTSALPPLPPSGTVNGAAETTPNPGGLTAEGNKPPKKKGPGRRNR
jgi:hypothetical protein